jgi:feruloyl esterase
MHAKLPGVLSERAAGLICVLLMASSLGQAAKPAVSCQSLASLSLPDTKITLAQTVAAGTFKVPRTGEPGGPEEGMPNVFGPVDASHHPAFCRVTATLKPSSDSNINIEVWLPLSGWNGKFFGAGNLAWAGWIMYDGLLYGLQNGYAAANSDTGHELSYDFGRFVLGHPDRAVDYGYRAVHEMTVTAKAIVMAFYGVAPRQSYFVGCSLGGQQAMTEAQRFPNDYDAIAAGSPANPISHLNAADFWRAWLINHDPSKAIPAGKSAMVHESVMKTCGTPLDLKQGFLEDPEHCHFDPGTLLCKGADGPDCLTAPQVEFMKQVYAGPINPRTGEQIYPGPAPGSAEGMGGPMAEPPQAPEIPRPGQPSQSSASKGLGSGDPGTMKDSGDIFVNQHAIGLFKYMVFQDPKWDWKTLNFDQDIDFADKVLWTLNLPTNPNLKPFFDHGGKLLMYHGWSDNSNPVESINYYKAVLRAVGPDASNSMRVLTIPGMSHCSGGMGCDTFNKLAILDQWVETGKAPERIVASKLSSGKVIRTHPLCAYPQLAKYKGTGSADEAENFVCAEPEPAGK